MFASTSPDSAKAALIRQDSGRFPRSDLRDWSHLIMTQPALSSTLSPDKLHSIRATANAWRLRGYTQEANNLLIVAGLTSPTPAPSPLPSGVYDLSAYRSRRAVSR